MSYNQCVILIDTQSIIETFLTIYYSKRPLSCDSVHCLKINAPVISGICPVTVRYLLGINASFPLSFLCFIACIMSFYHFLFLVFRLRALRLPIAGPTARNCETKKKTCCSGENAVAKLLFSVCFCRYYPADFPLFITRFHWCAHAFMR